MRRNVSVFSLVLIFAGGCQQTTRDFASAEGGGGAPPCSSNEDCNDMNPCTSDACDGADQCTFLPLGDLPTPGVPDLPGDCVERRCVSGVDMEVVDDSETPDDNDECTQDICSNGQKKFVYLQPGSSCTQGFCDNSGKCVECSTDADCATSICIDGICKAPQGGPCAEALDCQTGFCVDNICCNTACDEVCAACNVTDSFGACAVLPVSAQDTFPAGACVSPMACDGMGIGTNSCKKANSQPCQQNSECATGVCMAGKCQ
jgi:hypothetical protein